MVVVTKKNSWRFNHNEIGCRIFQEIVVMVFFVLAPCRLTGRASILEKLPAFCSPEDGWSVLFSDVGVYLWIHMALQHIRTTLTAAAPQVSHVLYRLRDQSAFIYVITCYNSLTTTAERKLKYYAHQVSGFTVGTNGPASTKGVQCFRRCK